MERHTKKPIIYLNAYKLIATLLLCIWLLLFILGGLLYKGSLIVYVIFSFAYLALLISGFYKKLTYGYIFLTSMIWLGFWFKFIVHLLLNYPFVEPIGLFAGSNTEWDHVLLTSSLGAIGIIIPRLVLLIVGDNESTLTVHSPASPPNWYTHYRIAIWGFLVACILTLALINVHFSFQQIGLAPKTIIWPLNAIFSWLLSTGFALSATTLFWWEFSLKNGNIKTIYFLLIEATACSISLLSRGLFIFHITPLILSAAFNRRFIPRLRFFGPAVFFLTTFTIFMLSYPLINAIRDQHYSGIEITLPWQREVQLITDAGDNRHVSNFLIAEARVKLKQHFVKLAKFSVDRWIGLEGMMAVSSHPEKNIPLFAKLATEKAEIGRTSIFQEIALSHYRFMDSKKFLFASLPGPISFFHLSGSLWILLIGMSFVTTFVIVSEQIVFKVFKNPILASLWGSIVSTSAAQLGINTPGLIFYLFLCILGLLFLYLVQRSFFLRNLVSKNAKQP